MPNKFATDVGCILVLLKEDYHVMFLQQTPGTKNQQPNCDDPWS